ncbi:hypothetical protein MKK70_06865 [Methylobacterium sp. E-041]|uniref:hypothetical protein n=1 Tax=Methylobacterium sp. E-041 TaxID=2836573 RepID=UPI001FBBAE35|nr:hypothetical protein [Methylobacterium sp. E-041]MCJ2105106.1 hypothetical protein [Methylobacterium sp. E-041]
MSDTSLALRSPPTPFFVGHCLYRCDGILKLCDPLQRTVGWHCVVLSGFHDEIALAGLEAVQKGYELVHGAL